MPRRRQQQPEPPDRREPSEAGPAAGDQPADEQQRSGGTVEVGDRVRAKTTARTGEVTEVTHDGDREQVTVAYDPEPQDEYLTTPARDGAELPRELVDRLDEDDDPAARPA